MKQAMAVPPREWLDAEYHGKSRNLKDIADELGVSTTQVGAWMRMRNVSCRPPGRALARPTPDELAEKHQEFGGRHAELRDFYGVSEPTLGKWLRSAGIVGRRPVPGHHPEFPKALWGRINKGAVNRGISILIDAGQALEAFFKQGGRCLLTDRPLSLEEAVGDLPPNASLDRLTSRGPYTHDGVVYDKAPYAPGNIAWLEAKVNIAKGDMDFDEFVEMCVEVAVHNGKAIRIQKF